MLVSSSFIIDNCSSFPSKQCGKKVFSLCSKLENEIDYTQLRSF